MKISYTFNISFSSWRCVYLPTLFLFISAGNLLITVSMQGGDMELYALFNTS